MQTIVDIHFMFVVLISSIVVDYNTINDIYYMICILQNKVCVLQKMVLANHVWDFHFLDAEG
jgi:hypothetical protein